MDEVKYGIIKPLKPLKPRKPIRKKHGIYSKLSDRHLGMILNLNNDSRIRKAIEKELRKRHNGKFIIEL